MLILQQGTMFSVWVAVIINERKAAYVWNQGPETLFGANETAVCGIILNTNRTIKCPMWQQTLTGRENLKMHLSCLHKILF